MIFFLVLSFTILIKISQIYFITHYFLSRCLYFLHSFNRFITTKTSVTLHWIPVSYNLLVVWHRNSKRTMRLSQTSCSTILSWLRIRSQSTFESWKECFFVVFSSCWLSIRIRKHINISLIILAIKILQPGHTLRSIKIIKTICLLILIILLISISLINI